MDIMIISNSIFLLKITIYFLDFVIFKKRKMKNLPNSLTPKQM